MTVNDWEYIGILDGMDIFTTEHPIKYEKDAIAGHKILPCPQQLILAALVELTESYSERRIKRIYDFVLAPKWYCDLIRTENNNNITRDDDVLLIMPYDILPEEQKLKHIQQDNRMDVLRWVMLDGEKNNAEVKERWVGRDIHAEIKAELSRVTI